MTSIEKYKERLKQLENGGREIYEGELEVIRKVLASSKETC